MTISTEDTQNTVREPYLSDTTPPSSGPTALPTNWAVCIIPRAKPMLSSGVSAATRVSAAGTVPQNTPCNTRSSSNTPGVCASPMANASTAPATVARTSIATRPTRSARAPQIGWNTIMLKAAPLLNAADQATAAS